MYGPLVWCTPFNVQTPILLLENLSNLTDLDIINQWPSLTCFIHPWTSPRKLSQNFKILFFFSSFWNQTLMYQRWRTCYSTAVSAALSRWDYLILYVMSFSVGQHENLIRFFSWMKLLKGLWHGRWLTHFRSCIPHSSREATPYSSQR